jgi:hypothetical protein
MEIHVLDCPCPICCGVPYEDARFQHHFEHHELEMEHWLGEIDPEPPEPWFHPLMDIAILDWLEDGDLDFFGLDD